MWASCYATKPATCGTVAVIGSTPPCRRRPDGNPTPDYDAVEASGLGLCLYYFLAVGPLVVSKTYLVGTMHDHQIRDLS